MSVLITGGFGKTASHLAKFLHEANHPYIIATRKGTAPAPYKAAKFDWFDPTTYENPFKADPNIDRLYLVAPPGFDLVPAAQPFVDFAVKEKGIKRIVLLSGAQVEKGDLAIGKLHAYVDSLGIDYVVLRATWFLENLVESYGSAIRNDNEISSSVADGRVPHVSAQDVAKAAFEALLDEAKWPRARAPRVFGPEPITFDEIATTLSEVLGRKIAHRRLPPGSARPDWQDGYFPEEYKKLLTRFEVDASNGKEEEYFHNPEEDKYIGFITAKEYIIANKEAWLV